MQEVCVKYLALVPLRSRAMSEITILDCRYSLVDGSGEAEIEYQNP